MIKNTCTFLLSVVCGLALSACSDANSDLPQQANSDGFVLSSTQMSDGDPLPITYTCDGDSVSPPLSWSGAPKATKSYALVMHHNAPDGVHWYWTLYNINADTTQIDSGETLGQAGTNSVNQQNAYAPPCSKGPGEKNYTYTVYALSAPVAFDDQAQIDRAMLLDAIKDITLSSAQMTVSYSRANNGAAPDRKPRPEHATAKSKPDSQPAQIQVTELPAHAGSERCDAIKRSIDEAGFEQSVSVSCDETYAYVASSTYPDHEVMTGITGTNEQIPVPAKGYAAPIKLNPEKADELTTIDAALGVAVNGVPIYDYSSQGELDLNTYDAKHDTLVLGQLDNCGGHSGRGDDYHYHVSPTCMINVMKNQAREPIIGWAYDGYPLYGHNSPDGSKISEGVLDVCNGQSDNTFGYRYHTSVKPPYIIQCLVGKVDTSILPRIAPLSGDTHKIRGDLRPPAGGVENLQHTIAEDGSRTMSYSYHGEDYFTTYSPSTSSSTNGDTCYDFKQRTISNGGKVESGTFCRDSKPSKLGARTAVKAPAPVTAQNNLKLEAWADNWFAAYIGDALLVEDSVPITTERSFNAETIEFSASYPIELNVIVKDFKQNDTGLEYIGTRRQQIGDGGFIAQITDTNTNKVVAVTDQSWKCEVLHQAPLDKMCERETNPIAGQAPCTFMSKDAPADWLQSNFDDSQWPNATEHSASAIRPKDGYDEIDWDDSAKIIWGSDIETDNILICRTTIEQPQ